MKNGLERKDIFTSAAGESAPCTYEEKKKTAQTETELQECKGVDRCINGLMAHLTYKAADKALGVEKRKEWAEGNGNRGKETECEGNLCLSSDAGMTRMLQQPRTGPQMKSNNAYEESESHMDA